MQENTSLGNISNSMEFTSEDQIKLNDIISKLGDYSFFSSNGPSNQVDNIFKEYSSDQSNILFLSKIILNNQGENLKFLACECLIKLIKDSEIKMDDNQINFLFNYFLNYLVSH